MPRRGRRGRRGKRSSGGRGLLCCFGQRKQVIIQPVTNEEVITSMQLQQQLLQGNLDENTKAQLLQMQMQNQQMMMQNNGQLKPDQLIAMVEGQRNTLNQIKRNQGLGTTLPPSEASKPADIETLSKNMQTLQMSGTGGGMGSSFASGTVYSQPFTGAGTSSTTFASGTVYSEPFSQQYY